MPSMNTVASVSVLQRLSANDRALADVHAARATLAELISTLKDLETGQRGYTITGEGQAGIVGSAACWVVEPRRAPRKPTQAAADLAIFWAVCWAEARRSRAAPLAGSSAVC